jgi:hypothetical protein
MRRFAAVLAAVLLGQSVPIQAQTSDSAGSAVTAAQAAAGAWLNLVDHAQYGDSWDSAADVLRHALTRANWDSAARKARAPFGPLGKRRLLAASFQTRLPGSPPGEYVVLQYQTSTGGGKTVIETVTPMKEQDGRWRVSGYYIKPE